MKLRHLEWLIGEPLSDPDVILYEILPYSREDADQIIRHLCALAKFDLEQTREDPASAELVWQAFRLIADAATARQAQLDLDELDRDLGKPPWPDRLRDLHDDRRQFAAVVGDQNARAALRGALIDTGLASRAGRRWLHYLRDHPDALRKTIERALEAPVMYHNSGRRNRFERVVFAQGVGRAYELLTGRPFGRSVTSETKNRPEGTPTGPGLRLVSICIKPLDPHINDNAIVWAIRRAKALPRQAKLLIRVGDCAS
jgi:hypothetical protein